MTRPAFVGRAGCQMQTFKGRLSLTKGKLLTKSKPPTKEQASTRSRLPQGAGLLKELASLRSRPPQGAGLLKEQASLQTPT